MEKGIGVPSPSARGECILPVQIDHRRWSASPNATRAADRGTARVQRLESDDRTRSAPVLQHRPLRCAQGQGWIASRQRRVLQQRPATLCELVTVARSRWPIEQQYRELKDDLGLDHFEGRSYRGWGHHTVLTALAFTFLQLERMRSTAAPPPTLPHVRFWVREIMAVLYIIGNRKLLNLIVSFQRSTPLRR